MPHIHGANFHCLPSCDIQMALFEEGWIETLFPSVEELTKGIKDVQHFHGLPANGIVGYRTARRLGLLPSEPMFCGLPENIVVNGRPQWADAKSLTWALEGSIPGFPEGELKNAIDEAVKSWSEHAPVSLRYNGNVQTCNLRIITANLGGPGQVLADCEVPYGNQSQLTMRLDATERWRSDLDPVRVIRHECGHFYGVLHIRTGNLMAAMYSRSVADLQAGDIEEIKVRYPGGPVSAPTPPATPPPTGVKEVLIRIVTMTPGFNVRVA